MNPSLFDIDDNVLNAIADALAGPGYIVLEQALPENLLKSLVIHFNTVDTNSFKHAGVGRNEQYQLEKNVRSDKIQWIEKNTEVTAQFLQWMEILRAGINRRLFLGLFDYESHFARYPAGAFYKKHLDTFRAGIKAGQAVRVLSTVLYLNENWDKNNGGELVIYAENGEEVLEKIVPTGGRLVIFLSEKFPHEVLPAGVERNSIAGWFRINP